MTDNRMGDLNVADMMHRQKMEMGSQALLKALDRFFTERKRRMGKKVIG